MIHIGSYDTMSYSTYSRIKNYIKDNKLTICGDVYEEEMINYITEQNLNNFVIRISVPIA